VLREQFSVVIDQLSVLSGMPFKSNFVFAEAILLRRDTENSQLISENLFLSVPFPFRVRKL